MLADEMLDGPSGALTRTVHRPSAWLETVIEFIYARLATWRDDPDRLAETGEIRLTAQLCQFLNGATIDADLDSIVFQAEVPDPKVGGRVLDLVPGPRGCTIWIEGRRYSIYDPILPIECKRLPTPREKNRERREYLHTQKRTVGGVQRFKSGVHGSEHAVGVMVGYVQEASLADWLTRINHWVRVLSRARIAGWSSGEALVFGVHDGRLRTARHYSVNARTPSTPITLHHLWIDMRSPPTAASTRAGS